MKTETERLKLVALKLQQLKLWAEVSTTLEQELNVVYEKSHKMFFLYLKQARLAGEANGLEAR